MFFPFFLFHRTISSSLSKTRKHTHTHTHTKINKQDVIGVDDGTGVIQCLRWHTDSTGRTASTGDLPELGDCVRVCGKLKYPNWTGARGKREINVDCVTKLDDPNFEFMFWLQAIQLGLTEYKTRGRDKRKAERQVGFVEPRSSRRRLSEQQEEVKNNTTTTIDTTKS